MFRTAGEVLRSLEMRVARLEMEASTIKEGAKNANELQALVTAYVELGGKNTNVNRLKNEKASREYLEKVKGMRDQGIWFTPEPGDSVWDIWSNYMPGAYSRVEDKYGLFSDEMAEFLQGFEHNLIKMFQKAQKSLSGGGTQRRTGLLPILIEPVRGYKGVSKKFSPKDVVFRLDDGRILEVSAKEAYEVQQNELLARGAVKTLYLDSKAHPSAIRYINYYDSKTVLDN